LKEKKTGRTWLPLSGTGVNGPREEVTTVTDHYYISNMVTSAEEFAAMIRGHWSIENQLYWSLDVLFREDAFQVRKDRAPENRNCQLKHRYGYIL
jgi:predicted transposase YbfD/YdcC